MKILYVLPETPFTDGGGIATYLRHALHAMTSAGHEVFIFTWKFLESGFPTLTDSHGLREKIGIPSANIRLLPIEGRQVWSVYPNGPWGAALSHFLVPHIVRMVRDCQPDIIESSDYCAPLLGYLMHRRAGLLDGITSVPVAIYNHGMQRELYRCNAAFPSTHARQDLAAERTTLRWSDIVLVPSRAAQRKYERQMGATTNSILLREPFVPFEGARNVDLTVARYTLLGRVSYSKGLDYAIHFLNVADTLKPIEEVLMIGGIENTTFRDGHARTYVHKRLSKRLGNVITFTGPVPATDVAKYCASGGFSLNFSEETFNYAFIEQLQGGLVPLTRDGTAMAEFYPDHLRDHLLDETFDLSGLSAVLDSLYGNGSGIVEQLYDHTLAMASPRAFAANYERIAANLMARSAETRFGIGATRRTFAADDVTVLMATHNPRGCIDSAVASALAQTQGPREVLIIDDGSSDTRSTARLELLGKQPLVRVERSDANEGLCASRVKLLKSCKTALAIFLDDDDRLDPTYIEKTLRTYNASPAAPAAVVTWRQNFGESNELVIHYNMDDHEHYLANDFRMTALVDVTTLRQLSFTSSMRNGEADDWDFWLRFKNAGHRIVCLPEPLFLYHFRHGSMSWPWSEGQSALTADLISRRVLDAVECNAVARDLVLDLVCMNSQTRRQLEAAEQRLQSQIPTSSNPDRWGHIVAVKKKRPVVGFVLEFVYRVTTSLAYRLS